MNSLTLILQTLQLDSVSGGLGISLKLPRLLVSAAVQLLEYTPKTHPAGLRALTTLSVVEGKQAMGH